MEARPLRTIDDLIRECEKSLGKYHTDSIIALFKYLTRTKNQNRNGRLEIQFANARNSGLATNRFSALKKVESVSDLGDFSLIFEGGHFDLGDAASPFPAQLFDEIIKDSKSGNEVALKFLDIFVDRLTQLDFSMREALSFDLNPFSFEDNSTLGMFDEMTTIKEDFICMPTLKRPLNFQTLKNYSFQQPTSAHVTKLILEIFFGSPVSLEQFCINHFEIPRVERLRLAVAGEGKLGKDSILGRYSPNANSALEILVIDLPPEDVDILIVNQAFLINLKVLFRALFSTPITIALTLCRKSGKGLRLGNNAMLGRNSWMNSNSGDYAPVTLKFNSWESQIA